MTVDPIGVQKKKAPKMTYEHDMNIKKFSYKLEKWQILPGFLKAKSLKTREIIEYRLGSRVTVKYKYDSSKFFACMQL